MKVAIYARYSSDNQRDASIADQLRICREFAARQSWTVVEEFTDHAISGATLLRSGFQALMRDALNRRINARVKQMIDAGWLEETRGLVRQYGALSRTAAEATGYHELIQHLAGRIPLDEAIEQIKIATRQLARRQMKWFRRFKQVTWLAGDRAIDEQVTQIVKSDI